jgi:hypothetical protein
MKKLLSLLVLLIFSFVSVYSQKGIVAKTPAVNYDWRPGMINIPELSYGIGLSETKVPYSASYFSITNVTGYQYSRHVKLGIGYGVQLHNGGTLFPLFIDARVSPGLEEWVPFLAATGGCAMSFSDFSGESRIFFGASGGVRYVAAPKRCLTFSIGLLSQAGGAERRSSFFNFKLGVEFKGKAMKF